ncbi:MAG TPA: hypothetical protein VFI73_02940 [Candidatus Nitrosopolaris sp.]|nr:hypothetical protein [Candidatus Nitrosopolaris sp.]
MVYYKGKQVGIGKSVEITAFNSLGPWTSVISNLFTILLLDESNSFLD